MRNSICSGIKQAMNTQTVLVIITVTLLIFVSSIDALLQLFPIHSLIPNNYHTDFLLNALCSDATAPFVAILAVLPFAASYIDDVKSKYVRFCLIRSSLITYLATKVLVCYLCGSFIITAGVLLAWGTSALVFLPMERVAENPHESISLLLKTCGLLFLTGGLWAVVGMAMSTLIESKYIAYASPFVIYYLLVILCERYFPDAYLLYPPNWANPDVWPYGFWGAAIFLLELTLAFGILFVIRAGRRLREL